MSQNKRDSASFRDPNGFLFWRDGVLFRQVNQRYKDNYSFLMNSGLYQNLVDGGLLIPHEEVSTEPFDPENIFRVICPERIPFITYPYEWSFGQLKDAALTTLAIQKQALTYEMSLKDSSAYNIQFWRGKPILIDTLSFEKYEVGKPWVAYRQFCQHFLAPLALMSYRDVRLSQLLRSHIDGIPLDLTSKLLPFRTRFNFHLLTHIHFHAVAQKRYAGKKVDLDSPRQEVTKTGILGILSSLESIVRKLYWNPDGTTWADYDSTHNYSDISIKHKKQIITTYLEKVTPNTVWDLGANTGMFSMIAAETGASVISFDIDPGAVEKNYLQVRNKGLKNVLPLLQDLNNPSTDIGWALQERDSLINRGPVDICLVLALVHHLAISNNVPLKEVARFLQKIAKFIIIEFVPKEDSQVKRLLATREDIFPNYNQNCFEDEFSQYFRIVAWQQLNETNRIIYLMENLK